MPELPEILTIKKDLKKEILGKIVAHVEFVAPYPLKQTPQFILKNLKNQRITKISNVAKLLTIHLQNTNLLAIHLNMSGRLLYNTTDPYIKIKLHLNNKDTLHFSSVRMFETFKIMTPLELGVYKKQYGKTIISKKLGVNEFIEKMKKKNTYIKNNLLDQKLISGIGNIYANDALYLSKINPETKTNNISPKEYIILFNNLQLLINESILHRGSTIDRYTDIYGKPGSHQNYFRVYGKKNTPCSVCGTKITFKALQGRGTYYCTKCQPIDKNVQKTLFM